MKRTRTSGGMSSTALRSIQYSIDFVTAILLLTGQITVGGIFVVPEGFYLSATGEILGGVRVTGRNEGGTGVLRMVNVITALLLIVNAIRVTGPYVTSGRVFLVFGGPIFGIKEVVGVANVEDMNQGAAGQLRDYLRESVLNQGG